MGRARARLLAATAVIAVSVVAAYASLAITQTSASSNFSIPTNQPGRIIFSIRNTNAATSITVNGVLPLNPVNTVSCSGMSIGRLDGGGIPFTLAPNEQMQFIVSSPSAGYMNMGQYSCSWGIDTDEGQYNVSTTFNVGSNFGPGSGFEMQPAAIDFGTRTTGNFEIQKVRLSNYIASRNVDLSITNDLGMKDITFAAGACANQTTCSGITLPSNGTLDVLVQCNPVDREDVNAVLTASLGGSGFGSSSVHCNANPSSIFIADDPILISSMATTQITGTSTLATASITGDPGPDFRIMYCNASSCTWTPAQDVSGGYPLTVTCNGTAGSGTLSVVATDGGSDSSMVSCLSTMTPPTLSVDPVNSFGQIVIPGSSTQMVTFQNTGGSTLTGLAITFVGTDGTMWSTTDCTPGNPCSLTAGAMGSAMVTFTPSDNRGASATMRFSSTNAPQVDVPVDGTGLGGELHVLDPANKIVDFGSIPRGQLWTKQVTLSNPGNYPYDATAGTVGSPYSVMPSQITVNVTNSFTVGCQSATATSSNNEQTLSITSDAFRNPSDSVTLRCKIIDTLVQVTPTQLDFGEQRKGTDPNPRTIVVTVLNPSDAGAAAHVSGMQLRTSIAGLSLSPPMTDVTLQPGDTTTATLQLSTNADTTITNEFLDINVDNVMLALPVTGKVVTPSSRVVPQTLDLGTACVGTSVSGNVMLVNDGTATLMVDAPEMDGNSSFLASSSDAPGLLLPNMSMTAMVTPSMSAMGVIDGTLLWHDDVPITHMVPIQLEYVSSGTALSPKGLDFGILDAGMTSNPQMITLQNCDDTPVHIKVEALRTSKGALAAWELDPPIGYGKDLSAKEKQGINVKFKPPARGTYEALLDITTPAGTQKVHLMGEATGRDYDNTSFYACACSGPGAPSRGWPIALAIVLIVRRRRAPSSPR